MEGFRRIGFLEVSCDVRHLKQVNDQLCVHSMTLGGETKRRIYGVFDGLLVEVNGSEQSRTSRSVIWDTRTDLVGVEDPEV